MSDEPRIVRLEARQLRHVTLVIRCRGVRKLRVRLALWLMRLAGRVGGFKSIKLVKST